MERIFLRIEQVSFTQMETSHAITQHVYRTRGGSSQVSENPTRN